MSLMDQSLSLLGLKHHLRTDCPLCRGRNTFSITKENGKLKVFCFKASCNAKGIYDVGRSMNDIQIRLRRDYSKVGESVQRNEFTLPTHFVPITTDPQAYEWLEKNNCADAYWGKRIDVCFDPKLRRVVFVVERCGTIIDAVGRRLTMGASYTPKWYRYGTSRYPFSTRASGNTNQVVVVEDAASAAAASAVLPAIALMGTHMTTEALEVIREYDNAIFALDPDARKKSLNLARSIDNAVVRFISDDLKYMKPDQIRKELKL